MSTTAAMTMVCFELDMMLCDDDDLGQYQAASAAAGVIGNPVAVVAGI